MCGVQCWNTIEYTFQSWQTSCLAKRRFCQPYGMICFTSLLIRRLHHYCNRFRSCVAATVGQWHCLNTEWAIDSWYSSLKHLSCRWKALQNLIRYSWMFNVQLYVHLKKWTLKFTLLYLLNHISYLNKICR